MEVPYTYGHNTTQRAIFSSSKSASSVQESAARKEFAVNYDTQMLKNSLCSILGNTHLIGSIAITKHVGLYQLIILRTNRH